MKMLSTIPELQNYVSVAATMKLTAIAPHLNRAENMHLRPVIGKPLYDEFAAAYTAACAVVDALPAAEKAAVLAAGGQYLKMPEKYWEPMRLIQDAVCNIAFVNYAAQGQMIFGENTISISVNENRKTAFQWQIEDLKFQAGTDGLNAIDALLLYLENHLEDFPDWAASDAYFLQKEFFVDSARAFNKYYYINNSRMTYLTLRYIMRRIEEFVVKPIVSEPLFALLKDTAEDALSSKQRILIDKFLEPGITLLTVAKGVVERAIEATDMGVQVNLYSYYSTIKVDSKKQRSLDDKSDMVAQLVADGNEFLAAGRKYIEANLADFPEFVAETDEDVFFRVINSEDRKIFGV